jgi:hypothetical protein
VGRTEIARTIESARLIGDLSENGDYHAAKDAQGKMESRIRQIDNVIRNHEIVERDEHSDAVEYASIVQSSTRDDDDDRRSSSSARSRRSPTASGRLADLATRQALLGKLRATSSSTRPRRACCASRSWACARVAGRTLYEKIWDEHVVERPRASRRSSTSTCTSCTR